MRFRRYRRVLALVAIPLGLLLGALAGGSVRRLASVRLRYELLVLVAFVVQGVLRGRLAATSPSAWGLVVWAIVSLVLAVLLLAQARSVGLSLLAAGTMLNLLVVLLNQGMPVAMPADQVAGRIVAGSAGFYQLAHQGTIAVWLADVMPVRLGSSLFAVSAGDVLLCVGAALFIVGVMLRGVTAD